MAATAIRGGQQVADATVVRADLQTNGAANTNVIAKAVQGTAITLSSTGGDAGTGDVTISVNVGVNLSFTSAQTITVNDAETGGASTSELTVAHTTTGTPGTNLGSTIEWQAETDTGNVAKTCGKISCQWSTIADATRTSYMDFQCVNSATNASKMRLFGSGGLCVNRTTDPGAGYVDANTGFKIAGTVLDFPNFAGTTSSAQRKIWYNRSTSTVSGGYAADTYLAGSSIVVGTAGWATGGLYRCLFDILKTGAGVATFTVSLRVGTAGTTSDTAITTFSVGAGTAVADQGQVEVIFILRSTGLSAAWAARGTFMHNNTSNAGLWPAPTIILGGFAVSGTTINTGSATTIGLSINGGTSFSGTVGMVEAQYSNI